MHHAPTTALAPWPYPRWIAHRGAGRMAPENTLAAFRLGAAHGWRMFECDAKLSADGVLFLLHDATLERTTNGHGTAGELPWAELSQLDAGAWHSRAYAGEALPTLAALMRWCLHNHLMLNIEIKPTPGREYETGDACAALVTQLWPAASAHCAAPLLTSFSPAALAAARDRAPQLPLGLLVDSFAPQLDGRPSGVNEVLHTACTLGCVAIVLNHKLYSAELIERAHAQGLRCASYTVNDVATAQKLIDWNIDSIITDRVDLFAPTQTGSRLENLPTSIKNAQ